MFAGFFCGFCRTFEVTGIVARIENAENADTVFCGGFDELIDDIVGIVAVSQKVLTAQQHHDLRVGHRRVKFAQAFPRIFI